MTARTPMFFRIMSGTLLLLASLPVVALAADPEAEFKAALGEAESAEAEAAALRNRWTVTEIALNEARQAAAKGDFDHATSAAKTAEALAKASIFQARSEKEAWKKLEIR